MHRAVASGKSYFLMQSISFSIRETCLANIVIGTKCIHVQAGISFSTSEATLKEAFSKYGEVLEGIPKSSQLKHSLGSIYLYKIICFFSTASIIRDKDKGRSKGYGYVAFATSDDAVRALDDMNGKVASNPLLWAFKTT